jgi:ribosomal protein S5
MRRTLREGDKVTVTLSGETREFGPDHVSIQVVETKTRAGETFRFAMLTVLLEPGVFPEDMTEHLTRMRETG